MANEINRKDIKIKPVSSKGNAARANTKATKSSLTILYFKNSMIIYLKNESTNSYLLKTCKSSIPSPTPIYLTGI